MTISPGTLLQRAPQAFTRRPLPFLLLLGAVVRLVAALCSPGFLTSDDHHVLVGAADTLASGLPLPADYKRSVLYPGAVALIMAGVRSVGITSPDVEMLVVRLIHAGYSLLGVYLVFRILDRQASRDRAILGGLFTAAFFAFPVTAVHQFEEAVCQVPLLAGWWWLVRAEDARVGGRGLAVLAGAAIAIALILRFPLLSFVAPLIALIWYRHPRQLALYWTLGLVSVLVLQGASNAVVNGEWWYSFKRYYGPLGAPLGLVAEAGGYPSGPVWQYLLTLLGAFVPPFSLLVAAAMLRGGRDLPLLGVPALAFFVAHSLIANKQERFLLPILPVLVLLGAAGFPAVNGWFTRRSWRRVYQGLWVYFGVVNATLLATTVLSYGKKDRVAPLVYVQRQGDATGVVVAQYSHTFAVPVYYLGRPRPPVFRFESRTGLPEDVVRVRAGNAAVNYVILYSDSSSADSALLERALGKPLVRATTISPSLGDWLAHKLNPRHNKARTAVVYTTR
ncbi:MAG: hypothetical protein HYS40_00570 [Gemmatimonadetes bacterium]|nr:hypothetical protein [Gemmatimonadota bacterium]